LHKGGEKGKKKFSSIIVNKSEDCDVNSTSPSCIMAIRIAIGLGRISTNRGEIARVGKRKLWKINEIL